MLEEQHRRNLVKNHVDELKTFLDEHLSTLTDVASDLHANPEIRFTEDYASRRLTHELEDHGFEVQRGYAGLETAFVARWHTADSSGKTPTVAIFCEYDALEEIGHACGHNIIAASGLGAGLLVKSALEASGDTAANLVIIGSPGEEGGAGKVPMIEDGVLDEVDLAIMVHPYGQDTINGLSLARMALEIEFTGRASHAAAAPELGRNALDAATLTLNAIGLLRQQLRDDVRIHAIITNGGQAPNIIPEHTGIHAFVRCRDTDYLHQEVIPRVRRCIDGAAYATECKAEVKSPVPAYDSLVSNPVLVEVADAAYRTLDRMPKEVGDVFGSTDMGNVSQIIPSIHPMISLGEGLTPHTRDFATAANGPYAEKTISDGALILAATALSIFRDPEIAADAHEAFTANTKYS